MLKVGSSLGLTYWATMPLWFFPFYLIVGLLGTESENGGLWFGLICFVGYLVAMMHRYLEYTYKPFFKKNKWSIGSILVLIFLLLLIWNSLTLISVVVYSSFYLFSRLLQKMVDKMSSNWDGVFFFSPFVCFVIFLLLCM